MANIAIEAAASLGVEFPCGSATLAVKLLGLLNQNPKGEGALFLADVMDSSLSFSSIETFRGSQIA
jgi:hypothetical protein